MSQDINMSEEDIKKAKQKNIIRVMLILAAVTALEFVFAFTLQRGVWLTILYFALTIAKAYYIVSEFMHLGHEVRSLRYSIIFPLILIIWLLVALLVEGTAIFEAGATGLAM